MWCWEGPPASLAVDVQHSSGKRKEGVNTTRSETCDFLSTRASYGGLQAVYRQLLQPHLVA